MATMLFYQNPLPLDKKAHRNLKLNRQNNYSFTDNSNSIPVAGFEFFESSRHYPIFFIKTGDVFIPLALLSLRKKGHDLGSNWKDAYVPAYVRRYPFMLSTEGLVMIDVDAPHFKDEAGDALFINDEGEASETLKEIIRFLESVDMGYKATEHFCKSLDEKGLLEPFNRNVRVDNAQVNLSDLYVINEKKMLETLSESEVYDWFKRGWLAWAHAHLHSVGSVQQIIRRAEALGVSPVDADAQKVPAAE